MLIMPVRTSPNNLTVDQLTKELKSRNVTLPKSSIRKEVLVDLYKKHVLEDLNDSTVADACYSSDDDDIQKAKDDNFTDVGLRMNASNNEDISEAYIMNLSDSELRSKLKSFDESIGPITNTTRSVYRRKLVKYLKGDDQFSFDNSTSPVICDAYSDSDDDEKVGNGNGQHSIDGIRNKLTEVTKTEYTRIFKQSVQPGISSKPVDDDGEDQQMRSMDGKLIRSDWEKESYHSGNVMSEDDNFFQFGSTSKDFHRRSLAVQGLTPRPPLTTYTPPRQAAARDDVSHRSQLEFSSLSNQAKKSGFCKNKKPVSTGIFKFLLVLLIIAVLGLFGYLVYVSMEPNYFPRLY